MPRAAISSTVGLRGPADHVVDEVLGRPRQRRVGAHAAGVRALRRRRATRLKSCAGCSGTHRLAVGDREQRDLRAVEVLLDHDAFARGRRGRGGWRSSVTTTPLPAASASSLTTYGGPKRRARRPTCSAVSHTRAIAVGTSAAAMTCFAKAFEPSSWAASRGGAEAGDAAPRARHRPRRRRAEPRGRRRPGRRRSASARSATAAPSSRVDRVQCGDGSAMPGLPGAAWTSVTCGSRERARDQGVLTAAGADDENLHPSSLASALRGAGTDQDGAPAEPAVTSRATATSASHGRDPSVPVRNEAHVRGCSAGSVRASNARVQPASRRSS